MRSRRRVSRGAHTLGKEVIFFRFSADVFVDNPYFLGTIKVERRNLNERSSIWQKTGYELHHK